MLAIDFTFSGREMVEELLCYTQRNEHVIESNCNSKDTSLSASCKEYEACQQCNFEHGSAPAGARANEPDASYFPWRAIGYFLRPDRQTHSSWTMFGANLRSHDNMSSLLKASALLSLKRYDDSEPKRRGTQEVRGGSD
jgi:hypothetical protein